MKIQKKTNGITLIALIVTIIILLILTTIAILELKNINLFTRATESRNKYKQTEKIENNTLDDYANKIDEFKIDNSNKIDELKIDNSTKTTDDKKLIPIENICIHPALMTSYTEPFGEIKVNSTNETAEALPWRAFNVYGDTHNMSPYYGRFFHRAYPDTTLVSTYRSDWPFVLKGIQVGKTYDSGYYRAKVECSTDGKNFKTIISDTGTNSIYGRWCVSTISDDTEYYYLRCTNLEYYGYYNVMAIRAYGTLYMPEEEYQKYETVTIYGISALKLKGADF